MPSSDTFLIALFLGVNLAAFLVMGWDKWRSRQTGAERIPEGLLFFMAIAFGSLGVFAGMFAFRHKTRTWYFLLGIPLAFAQNVATLMVLGRLLGAVR
jgi:uncharacterized membrane protein YsdA (DUF1294 family)